MARFPREGPQSERERWVSPGQIARRWGVSKDEAPVAAESPEAADVPKDAA